MFVIKKIISQLLMPIPMVLVLLIIALFVKKGGKFLAMLSVSLLLFFSSSWGSNLLLSPLENQYKTNNTPINNDCIIMVLGAGHDDFMGAPALQQLTQAGLKRVIEGVRQYKLARHQGKHCEFFTSGFKSSFNHTAYAQIAAKASKEMGVLPQDIKVLTFPKDTIEEAAYLHDQIGNKPFRLVTSANHMPRAMMIFHYAGMKPEAAASDFRINHASWWIFSAQNLMKSQSAIHEYMGILWLWIKYQIRGKNMFIIKLQK